MFMANQRRRTDFLANVDKRLMKEDLSEDIRGYLSTISEKNNDAEVMDDL
jgi:hypothetical protein